MCTGNEIGSEIVEPIATFVENSTRLTALDLCSVLAFYNDIACGELNGLLLYVGFCGQTTMLGMMG